MGTDKSESMIAESKACLGRKHRQPFREGNSCERVWKCKSESDSDLCRQILSAMMFACVVIWLVLIPTRLLIIRAHWS